jgi:hypothetical protein
MAKRYGVEVTGKCTICDYQGNTEMHHIISRKYIEKKAKRWQLERLARGLQPTRKMGKDTPTTSLDDESLRILLVNHNPNNIKELCPDCHKMTDSSFFHRKLWVEKQRKKSRKKRRSTRKGEKKTCAGFTLKSAPCKIGVRRKEYCNQHTYQAPVGHSQFQGDRNAYRPSRNREGQLTDEQEYALKDLYSTKGEVDDYIVELFKDKSDSWRIIWLEEEIRRRPRHSGREFVR